ncbi:hypothetical protein DFH09DRAFT_1339204 [Mycena vulgaris]|nr:hypothetical protein DFH09DRAFT_1339204 [Mycena vulgaris]
MHAPPLYECMHGTCDTDNVYSSGMSETVLGNAMTKLQLPREEIVMMTKWANPGDATRSELFLAGDGPLWVRTPLGRGALTHTAPDSAQQKTVRAASDEIPAGAQIAKKHNATTAQVVPAWITAKVGSCFYPSHRSTEVSAPIVGPSSLMGSTTSLLSSSQVDPGGDEIPRETVRGDGYYWILVEFCPM